MLQLEDITAGYGDAPLFSRLSLSVARGEMRLIQGASGCGKSTLLGIICGTADAALTWSGDVRLNDQSLSTLPAEDRRVGLIFQDALLFPHMTVGDNLAFGLAARYRRDRETAVADALGVAGLEGFGERDPAALCASRCAFATFPRFWSAMIQAMRPLPTARRSGWPSACQVRGTFAIFSRMSTPCIFQKCKRSMNIQFSASLSPSRR